MGGFDCCNNHTIDCTQLRNYTIRATQPVCKKSMITSLGYSCNNLLQENENLCTMNALQSNQIVVRDIYMYMDGYIVDC